MVGLSTCFTTLTFVTILVHTRAFQVKISSTMKQKRIFYRELKSMNNDGNEEPRLILGDEAQAALNNLSSKLPTSEAGYLEAARRRAEEARRQKELGQQQEEEEFVRESSESNFGPGDLSNFQGFRNDGFENSVGNDQTGGWDISTTNTETEETGETEEPSLYLFGDENEGELLL